MTSQICNVIPKTLYDFSNVPLSTFSELMVQRAIPVTQYREAVVVVRLYTITISAGQILDVRVRNEAPSDDDPSADFVNPTDLTVAAFSTAGIYVPTTITANTINLNTTFGSHLRVFVRGTQPNPAATLKAQIAIDLILKASV